MRRTLTTIMHLQQTGRRLKEHPLVARNRERAYYLKERLERVNEVRCREGEKLRECEAILFAASYIAGYESIGSFLCWFHGATRSEYNKPDGFGNWSIDEWVWLCRLARTTGLDVEGVILDKQSQSLTHKKNMEEQAIQIEDLTRSLTKLDCA